jgi:hypothetical protein
MQIAQMPLIARLLNFNEDYFPDFEEEQAIKLIDMVLSFLSPF